MRVKTVSFSLIGLLVFYGIIATVSESNYSCAYCHKTQHERWQVSTHKQINCRQCHIDPGVSGKLGAQLNGVKNIFVAVTKGLKIQPHKDPLPISTKNCLGCHSAILYVNEIGFEDLPENSLKGQSLKVSHRAHVEKHQVECVECHRGIVHRDPEKIGKYKRNWPLMHKDCSVCHDGRYWERFKTEITDLQDKSKCITCHPTYVPPPSYGDEENY